MSQVALVHRTYFVFFCSLYQETLSSPVKRAFLLSWSPLSLWLPTADHHPLAPRTQADPIVPTSSSGVVWPGAEVSGTEGRRQGSLQPFRDVPAVEPEVP